MSHAQDFDVKSRRVHIKQIHVHKFVEGDYPEVSSLERCGLEEKANWLVTGRDPGCL